MHKDALKLLKLVQKNDIKGYLLYKSKNRMPDNFIIDGTTLLHEARSPEMVAVLLVHKKDIRQKNLKGQTPEQTIKRNLKAVLKEKRLERLKKYPSYFKLKKLRAISHNLSGALRLIRLIRTELLTATYAADVWTQPVFSAINRCFNKASFHPVDKKDPAFYQDMSIYLADICRSTNEEIDEVKSYLEAGGYSDKKIKKSQHLLFGNTGAKRNYLLDENGQPLIFYRGTTQKNDPFLPLSHFGTIQSATDRLTALKDSFLSPNSRFVQKMLKFNWRIDFQILPVFLKMKNPFRLPEMGDHDIKGYQRLILHLLLLEKNGMMFIHQLYSKPKIESFQEQLCAEKLPKEFDYIFYKPYELTHKQVKKELFLGKFYPLDKLADAQEAEKNDREHLVFQRMIRFFEKRGYDGFVYQNGWEDVGKDSYIIFKTKQVVSPVFADKKELTRPLIKDYSKEFLRLEEAFFAQAEERFLTPKEAENMFCIIYYEFFAKSLIPDWVQKTYKKIMDRAAGGLLNLSLRQYQKRQKIKTKG